MRVPRVRRSLIFLVLSSSFLSFLLYFHLVTLRSLEQSDAQSSHLRFTIRPPVKRRTVRTNCSLPDDVDLEYPNCREKVEWLWSHWKDEDCFVLNGVKGDDCSIREYLSVVEQHCPSLEEELEVEAPIFEGYHKLDELFSQFNDTPDNYVFIKERITRLWPDWIHAIYEARKSFPGQFKNYRRKNIIVHLGFLMAETKMNFGSKSKNGGPLGELVQWSDLIACLYMLGHNLYISTQRISLQKSVDLFRSAPSCPGEDHLDLVITDIMGFTRGFRRDRSFASAHKCKFRLVDSFGTHAEFNTKGYFSSNRLRIGGKKNPWGGHALRLKQYWTFYPHTTDNSFLGFVVENDTKSSPIFAREKKRAVLIYGKEKYMWKGIEDVIQTLVENGYEVHSTVADADSGDAVFQNVKNHGFLSQANVSALLKSVGAFIGIGFPLEGPAPLEAVANGAVFINAKFDPPHSRRITPFLAEKPTLREFTSQCPYMESLGAPYAYTVDIHDKKELVEALRKVFSNPPKPHVPKEFTPLGMLLRVNDMLLNQDFCSELSRYPPRRELQAICGERSCDDVCREAGLLCEPAFFPFVNKVEELKRCTSNCSNFLSEADVIAPHSCTLQSSSLLFSCASVPASPVTRVCPCRSFVPDHPHFCESCI